ncbi:hypothetical protein FSP39_009618 [Pinctada imbricata]|uniref:HYR domain-containing protein n=1 Tax=Pinctada imbricata TaxID=66713 RepID=A0AA88Y8E8_PINIB|nr:hypothetical protein FSP39_009618 [Pinctada imbricata]
MELRHCACSETFRNEHQIIVSTNPDDHGRIATCAMIVKVHDPHPPTFVTCPSKIQDFDDEVISWVKPTVTDNVKVYKNELRSAYKNNTLFPNGNHMVTYVASDYEGNIAVCNFRVEIWKRAVCSGGCLNNGSCVADGFNVKCICPFGYHGDRCQNKTKIEKCRRIPNWFSTRCADRCSENRPCKEGETCCELNGEKICVIQRKYSHQQCTYRDRANQLKSVKVGDTYFNFYDNLCRCRPRADDRHVGINGKRDCTVMHCNLQNSNCKTSRADDGIQNINNEPSIVNCPLPGDHLPVYVDRYENTGVLYFDFDARDFRGLRLRYRIQEHVFSAQNTSRPDIYHNKVTSYPDINNNTAECCFTVEVIDEHPPRFLSCPADISAFTGETISWIKPKAVDNVGIRRFIEPFVTNGTLIGPGVHVFTYTAEDWSGNSAHCTFSVKVTDWSGAIVGILAIVMLILAGIVVRSCRLRAQNDRRLSTQMRNARSNREDNKRRVSVYSITNEPPPYDIAARDKLPEYTPRDDPPVYMEADGPVNELHGCDNPTYEQFG